MNDSPNSSQKTEIYHRNEKYFRPSKLPAINTIDLENFILTNHNDDPAKITLPATFTDSSENALVNFFSVLREANQETSNSIGCGTVGLEKLPYPIAYSFLSADLKKQLPYEQFLKLFENFNHINLVKMVKLPKEDTSNNYLFLIEIETVVGNCFCYYYGYLEVIEEDSHYRINSIDFVNEDFFCAPYHRWQHNAELKVDIMYGTWCKLIAKQYPALQEDYNKKIIADGTDGNQYMFEFFKLTNGTDIEIGQYRKTLDGQWNTTRIDPNQCLG